MHSAVAARPYIRPARSSVASPLYSARGRRAGGRQPWKAGRCRTALHAVRGPADGPRFSRPRASPSPAPSTPWTSRRSRPCSPISSSGANGRSRRQISTRPIAPTVFIAESANDPFTFPRGVADAAGRLPEWEAMRSLYEANIERAIGRFPRDGGRHLRQDPGLGRHPQCLCWLWRADQGSGGPRLRAHRLRAGDGRPRRCLGRGGQRRGCCPNFRPTTSSTRTRSPTGTRWPLPPERMAEVFPSWCAVLTSCAEGRYIVLPREYATGFSFAQLDIARATRQHPRRACAGAGRLSNGDA